MASPHPSGPLHLQANPKKGNGGFTLLELIFTLTILAVAGLAGTSLYRDAIIANQLHRATSTLVHDLALGRLEAVRRATRITLCPGNPEIGCTRGPDWETGWIGFADRNHDHSLSAGEELILHSATKRGVSIAWRKPERVSFNAIGGAWPNGHFRLCAKNPQQRRAVIVHLTGRTRVSGRAPGGGQIRCG